MKSHSTIMHPNLDTLPSYLTSLLKEQSKRPYTIAIIGGSNTGKSYAIRRMEQTFAQNDQTYVHISLDDYQKGDAFRQKDTSPYKWDDPENFSSDLCKNDLATLQKNNAISYPHFNLALNTIDSHTTKQPAPLIIFDGLFTHYNQLSPLIDYTVYLESPFYSRFLRRIFRHRQAGNTQDLRPFKHMIQNVYNAHNRFVCPEKDHADISIRTEIDLGNELAPYLPQSPKADIPPAGTCLFQKDGVAFYLHENTFVITYRGAMISSIASDEALASRAKDIDWEHL